MIEREPLGEATLLRIAHGKANALDLELLRAFLDALADLERAGRPLVITGSGAIFGAGVDLKRLVAGGGGYVKEFLPLLSDALLALFRFPLPVVAAINGHAIAGGAIVALACDRRVMSRVPARFGVPELRVGVPFPLVPLEILRAALRPDVLQEAMLLGATWEPDAALARGCIDEVVESERLLERSAAVATQLAQMPPTSYRITKLALRAPALERIERLRAESDAVVHRAWASEEILGAVRDYVGRTLRV